jgi:hypothetical protein
MNVQDCINQRRVLENRIANLVQVELDTFEAETGLTPESIDISLSPLMTIGAPTRHLVRSVTVRVSL